MLMLQAAVLLGYLLATCFSSVDSYCTSAGGTCSNALELDAVQSSKALVQAFRKAGRATSSLLEGPELNPLEAAQALPEGATLAATDAAAPTDASNSTAVAAVAAPTDASKITDAAPAVAEQDPASAAASAAAPESPPVDPAAQAPPVDPATQAAAVPPPAVPAPPPPPPPVPKPVIWSPTLDQAGYDWVKQQDCHFEQEQFVRRVSNALAYHVCDERGMQALVQKHFQGSASLNYADFSNDLLAGKDGQCPWIIDNGRQCPETAPAECPPVRWTPDEYLGGWKNDPVHRRRLCRNKNPGLAKITNVATDFVPPAPVPPLADAPPGTLPTSLLQQAASSQFEEKQRFLLQTQGVANQSAVGTPGTSAPLDDQGLQEVKRTQSALEMEYFVIRVIAKNNMHICNNGGLQGLLTAYKQGGDISPTGTLNYERIEQDIEKAASQECAWVASGPENKKNSCPPEDCLLKKEKSEAKKNSTSTMKTPIVKQDEVQHDANKTAEGAASTADKPAAPTTEERDAPKSAEGAASTADKPAAPTTEQRDAPATEQSSAPPTMKKVNAFG